MCTCFQRNKWMGIESCCNLILKDANYRWTCCSTKMKVYLQNSLVTMLRELILFGRAMNCRSFSTTPPSPLFRAAADFSSRCSHVSHSRYKSENGDAAGTVLLPLHPILPCCSLKMLKSYGTCGQVCR